MALDLSDAYMTDREEKIRDHYWMDDAPEGMGKGAVYVDKLVRGHITSLAVMLGSTIDSTQAMNRILIYLDGIVDELEEALLDQRGRWRMTLQPNPKAVTPSGA